MVLTSVTGLSTVYNLAIHLVSVGFFSIGMPMTGQPGGPAPQVQWMARPQGMPGCPPGLEYLAQIDQLLVKQQVELLEGW